MEFEYLYDDKPAIGRAITQAIGASSMCWEDVDQAGLFDIERALEISKATAVEVRRIITFELMGLLDPEAWPRSGTRHRGRDRSGGEVAVKRDDWRDQSRCLDQDPDDVLR